MHFNQKEIARIQPRLSVRENIFFCALHVDFNQRPRSVLRFPRLPMDESKVVIPDDPASRPTKAGTRVKFTPPG